MKRLKPIERSKDCAYRERLNLLCIAAAVLNSGASTQFLALHRSPHVRLSQLIPSHLSLSQLFSALLTTLLSSSQPMLAHLMYSHRFSPLLTTSELFSALFTSSQLISALLGSLSDHLSPSLAQSLLDLGVKAFKKNEKDNEKRQKRETSTSKTHRCNFGAIIPMRFAASCRPSDYLRNSNAEQLWRSRSNAISKRQVAEGQNLLQNPDRGAKDESNTIWKFF